MSNPQRLRSSTERWPNARPSAVGRRGSLVVWSKGSRKVIELANGKRALPVKAWAPPIVEREVKAPRRWMFS